MRNLIIAALVILLLGGGWYLYSRSPKGAMQADMAAANSYPYTCDNGATYSMKPSSDAASVVLSSGAQGMFTGDVTLTNVASTTRYNGTLNGTAVSFIGDGETMELTVGSQTSACHPVADPENAPWNWGDREDTSSSAGSVKQDASLITTENLLGKWRANDDQKFVREFMANDKITDYYDGKAVTSGLWVAFTKANAPKVVPFPIESNAVYVQITEKGSQQDTLNFKVQLSPDSNTLTLIYMDRGGATTYTRVP